MRFGAIANSARGGASEAPPPRRLQNYIENKQLIKCSVIFFNTSAQKSALKCFSIQNILMNNTFQVKQILLILSSKFLLMK